MSLEKLLVFNAAAALTQAAVGGAGGNLAVDPQLQDNTVRAKNLQVWETCRVFYTALIGALNDTTSWPEPQVTAGTFLPSLVNTLTPLLGSNPALAGLVQGLQALLPKPVAAPATPLPNPCAAAAGS
jgi:hypothetical protein